MSNSLLLRGRNALVTGGGGGIGRAVCKILARDGATIIATDKNENSVNETIDMLPDRGQHFAHTVNVGQLQSVEKLMSELKTKKIVPHILVNCAGITQDTVMLKMTEAMFDDVINVNLKGTYLMTQAVSKLMIEDGVDFGSIVNISSISGKIGNFGQCNYAASKAGVEGFTKTVARELASYNIRCNAVMPGFIDTNMVATVPQKVIDKIKKEIPLGRLGSPEEVAEMCAFLASQKSSYVTGGIFQVSGGLYM